MIKITGSVTRTYYDYSGYERYSEEIQLEKERLIHYLSALVFSHLNGRPHSHPPSVDQAERH